MSNQYSSAKICPYKKSNCKDEEKLYLEPSNTLHLPLNPTLSFWSQRNVIVLCFLDITDIMATSTDFDELTYLWSEWRKVASKPMRDDYKEYVRLENKAAEANGNFQNFT